MMTFMRELVVPNDDDMRELIAITERLEAQARKARARLEEANRSYWRAQGYIVPPTVDQLRLHLTARAS